MKISTTSKTKSTLYLSKWNLVTNPKHKANLNLTKCQANGTFYNKKTLDFEEN